MLDALEHLTRDTDADIRYYALYALTDPEGWDVDPARVQRTARHLIDDPDEQVRDIARAHSTEVDPAQSAT